MEYTNPEHTKATVGTSSGRVEDLIRLGYLKETDVIEPYVEPVPSADEVFTTITQLLVSGISQAERDTFERQEREALEWMADNEAPVKFIRTLAISRGIPIDGLVSKIIFKANLYSQALAKALGEKHKAEDLS